MAETLKSALRAMSVLADSLAKPTPSQCADRSFWLTLGLFVGVLGMPSPSPVGPLWQVPIAFAASWLAAFGLLLGFSFLNAWSDRRLAALKLETSPTKSAVPSPSSGTDDDT